jgi:mannose-6-phosphate isomerase-like protein (cupin superfamily)
MGTRRVVVTQREDGSSFVAGDGESIRSHDFIYTPGMSESVLWSTRGEEIVSDEDQATWVRKRLPRARDTVFLTVTFPPDEVFVAEGFDAVQAASEQSLLAPDLVNCFEPGSHGMHATPTVDYVVVVSGEIWLDLGDGEVIHLSQGDTVVQNATRHAWRNLSQEPATLAVVMVGTE